MDLRAVRSATRPELVAAAAAAARNAGDLVYDAEILAEAHCTARTYSLAALAVEEVGKALSLAGLAAVPQTLIMRAPLGRMLEWHQLKQAAGQLVAAVPYSPPNLAIRLVDMPDDDLTRVLSALEPPVDEADRLKRGGLYVDIDQDSQILEPSQITKAAATRQLVIARSAAGAARLLLDPDEQDRVTHPCAEGLALSQSAVEALTEVGSARTPAAAAGVVITMVCKLRERMTGIPQRGLIAA